MHNDTKQKSRTLSIRKRVFSTVTDVAVSHSNSVWATPSYTVNNNRIHFLCQQENIKDKLFPTK